METCLIKIWSPAESISYLTCKSTINPFSGIIMIYRGWFVPDGGQKRIGPENRYLSHLEITLSLWFALSEVEHVLTDKNGLSFLPQEIFYNCRCQVDQTCSRTCSCPNLRLFEKKRFRRWKKVKNFKFFENLRRFSKIFKIWNNWARNWFSAKTFQKNDRTQKWPKMTDVAKLEIADVFS